MAKVILTPIAKSFKPKGEPDSKRDFEEQCQRAAEGNTWMWDDAASNKARPGDLFGFVRNNGEVQYHTVTEVHSDLSQRLESWANNVGHGTRQVLYLSDVIATQSWQEWIGMGGYEKVQGTMYVKKPELKDRLLHSFYRGT
jgi:hypothetical protein